MRKQEGSSELYADETCRAFKRSYFEDEQYCSLCGWDKMDHKPLTELEVMTNWSVGSHYATPKEAKVYVQTLVATIGQLKSWAKAKHDEYSGGVTGEDDMATLDIMDDAAHEIDQILDENLGSLVPGTGGAWGLSLNEGPIRAYPSKETAMRSLKLLRLYGNCVEIYAEIYTDGVHSWELQAL